MDNPAYSLIDSDLALASHCKLWQQKQLLALDTEFMRTNTFYPIPALLQLYDGSDCYLIDPLAINDWEPLRQIMLAPHITKVLHSCSEDLEVFERLLQTLPAPLFDTQIAAAFLGYGFSAGYARLIKVLFHIDIPKDETRSDWLQRPLSANQMNYAALDVIYLYQLYQRFDKELQGSEKRQWISACHQELEKQFYQLQEPLHYFARIKNSWQLTPPQQSLLLELCLWREQKAREKNRPRSHIVADDILWELALKQPSSREALKKFQPLPPNALRHHGEELLELILQHKHSSRPAPLVEEPLPREAGGILKQLKALCEQAAERINVAPEMLARKKDLQALVASALKGNLQLPDSLGGWRQPIIGDLLLEATRKWQTQTTAGQ